MSQTMQDKVRAHAIKYGGWAYARALGPLIDEATEAQLRKALTKWVPPEISAALTFECVAPTKEISTDE